MSTQPELAEAAAQDREERLRAVLETAVEGIVTVDQHGVIESVNAAAERMFGYSARELTGRNYGVLLCSPHREARDGSLDIYLRNGKAESIGIGQEVTGRRKDGSSFPMDFSVSELKLAQGRIFTGFIRDITERKRLEKEILEISDREQRSIGHDLHDGLCQHLAGIELMSQVLAQKIAAKSKAHAKQVNDIARHVREAISHTRTLARGLSPVTLESEGLTSALNELAANSEKIFHIQCRCDCREPVEIYDHAAATHLFRIAQEAVANAIKHGKARRIVISLRKVRARVILTVSDNGKGFPSRAKKSKGMGLRIMQSRAGMIGGTIAIEPNSGGGTNVTCAMPQNGSSSKAKKKDARKNKERRQARVDRGRSSDDAPGSRTIDR